MRDIFIKGFAQAPDKVFLPDATCHNKDILNLNRLKMYLNAILQYLIWPALIIMSWFVIKYALAFYEKKFPDNPEKTKESQSG